MAVRVASLAPFGLRAVNGGESKSCGTSALARATAVLSNHSRRKGRYRWEEDSIINTCPHLAIVTADHFSRAYEKSKHPEDQYLDAAAKARAQNLSQQTPYERFMTFGKENRYQIVGGSWVASMAIALSIVGRSPYLSTAQKLVQARVYAQALTLAVLVATAAFEIGDRSKEEGRWETVKYVDPDDPEHKRMVEKKVHHEAYRGEDQWRDMVEAEEKKEKARAEAVQEQEERDRKAGKIHHRKKNHDDDHNSHSNNNNNNDHGDDNKKTKSEGKDGGAGEMEKEGGK